MWVRVIDECLRERGRERERERDKWRKKERKERNREREMEILKFDKINRKWKGGKEIGKRGKERVIR